MPHLSALVIPLVVLAASAAQAAAARPHPAEFGRLCAASAMAEKNKDYAAAIHAMQSYQQRGGDPFISALRLGWLHFQAREYASASQAYRQAATMQPSSLNALLGILNATEALQDVRKTGLAADAVLRVEPTNYRALMVLAGLHFAHKDYRKAAAEYSRVLVNYPDDPDALSGAGWAALRNEDQATAAARFSLLLGINPDYPKAREGYDLANRIAR
jgi:tetratricopeptide (TPR) repeat protein